MRAYRSSRLDWIAWAVASLVFSFLIFHNLFYRPYFATGDETEQITRLLSILSGQPQAWHWGQGWFHRQMLAVLVKGFGPRAIHGLGIVSFIIEAGLLWVLSHRWWGPRAGAWALLVLGLSASTWLREGSLLGFQWLPAGALLLMSLSTRVTSLGRALGWGLVLALWASEYEAAVLATPFLILVCGSMEHRFRPYMLSAFLVWVLGLTVLVLAQSSQLVTYVGARSAISVKGDRTLSLYQAALNNWLNLIRGGEPRPYMALSHWPAMAPWLWFGFIFGLLEAWRKRAWVWFAWALGLPLVLLASQAPHGLPLQRLAVVAPVWALVAAWGFSRLEKGPQGRRLALLCLVVAMPLEAGAWVSHQSRTGAATWGRSQNQQALAKYLEEHASPQDAILTAWAEVHSPELRWSVTPRLPQRTTTAWVMAPLQLQGSSELRGRGVIFQQGRQSEPALLLKVQGSELKRWMALDRALKFWLTAEQSQRRVWLAVNKTKADPWLWAAVLETYGGPLPPGPEAPMEYYAWAKKALPITPSPLCWLAKTYDHSGPEYSLRLSQEVLAQYPQYSPALLLRLQALERLGRIEEAVLARLQWEQAFKQGAWPIYDRP